MKPWALAIHGGAGLIHRDALSPEREAACRVGLHEALRAGAAQLRGGASALDAVTETVRVLEEDPHFNAGKGAVVGAGERIELDASLMTGDRRVGAVSGVRSLRNPILAARAVLEHSPHVLLFGIGAEDFCAPHCESVPIGWHLTPERMVQYREAAGTGRFSLDHGSEDSDVYGTVGAVACDQVGEVAAATSTGGMVNKRHGRVGDSPIPGAGTFAWNRTAAVSSTGHGEPFLTLGAAARVSAWMEFRGLSVDEAVRRVLEDDLPLLDGKGGLIAIGANGQLSLRFNTAGMFRGWVRAGDPPVVRIWEDR